MRALALLGLTLIAPAALAQPAPQSAPCLAAPAATDGPVSIRDAKIVAWESAISGGPAASRQTVIRLQACAVIAGSAQHYVLTWRPVLFSADGHLLHGGNAYNQIVAADDPAKGGPAHSILSEDFGLGYAIDHGKLASTLMITGLGAAPCTMRADGTCAVMPPPPAVATINAPVCLADGTVPPPPQCPAAVVR